MVKWEEYIQVTTNLEESWKRFTVIIDDEVKKKYQCVKPSAII